MSDNETVVITGEKNIALFRLLAIRSGLSLEITTGMKRHGRPMSVIANEQMGTSLRTKRAVYKAFDAWLAENYGVESRPLKESK